MDDKVEGKWDEIKGDVTDDESEKLKGKAEQKIGDVKETADDLTPDTEKDEAGINV